MENITEKTKMQKQLQDMLQKKELVEERVKELMELRSQANISFTRRQRLLGSGTLSPRNTKTEYESMLREIQQVEDFDKQIAQCRSDIDAQEKDIDEMKSAISSRFYDQEVKDFEALALEYVKLFIQLGESFEVLKVKLDEAEKLREYGNVSEHDTLWKMQRVFNILNGQFEGGVPYAVISKVGSVEATFPDVVGRARKKK